MRIQVITNLNTRIGGPGRTFQKGIVQPQGTIIEVLNKVDGENIDNNNVWLFDGDNNYYWSGGVNVLDDISATSKFVTSDNKQSYQWFQQLNIPEIWSIYNEQGENATIAVLDTGYNITNPDLTPAITGQSLFINYSNSINDIDGHGTFCASVIGARNLYQYNVGIAPKCKLLIGKISNKGELNDIEYIFKGIAWAIKQGADIISISFGKAINELPDDYVQNIQEEITSLIANEKILIFAAANDTNNGQILTGENYPASLDGCVSVGASDNGLLSDITVRNTKTIIHAQGIDVESYQLNDTPEKDSGTSMSTPIVAGVVALAVSFLKKKNKNSWDPNTLLEKIYSTGDPILNFNEKKIINPLNLFKNL